MPELDLDPGAYRERKPKGWRWRLPWSHPEDIKLPMVMFFLLAGALGYLLYKTTGADQVWLILGTTAFALPAGVMLALWLRD